MKRLSLVVLGLFLVGLLSSCASSYKKGEQDMKKPVNCERSMPPSSWPPV